MQAQAVCAQEKRRPPPQSRPVLTGRPGPSPPPAAAAAAAASGVAHSTCSARLSRPALAPALAFRLSSHKQASTRKQASSPGRLARERRRRRRRANDDLPFFLAPSAFARFVSRTRTSSPFRAARACVRACAWRRAPLPAAAYHQARDADDKPVCLSVCLSGQCQSAQAHTRYAGPDTAGGPGRGVARPSPAADQKKYTPEICTPGPRACCHERQADHYH
ncbi:hypothetical protein DFH11DRAFT_1878017 [Phellopilus nigrolimitatus]|nr:hypothetical protein DFH11DRAFT_1878017 [Phellopilus nigrolimitatus]